ncbi:TetR family transcriptional regulator C-terminal domain-containing protein [Micromonospora sp. HNM0581]|uniref:TetR family transcriptional regulator C-terminal domain-containing protein n=1 Tax=Micromonospora sp. HNM0581 TaxID=2716341 RepID=UPI00321661F5
MAARRGASFRHHIRREPRQRPRSRRGARPGPPTSPLSPFSAESSGPREASIGLYAEVLAGSTAKVDAELRPQLPELLWLAYMGVVLFWVYDRSPGQTRTRQLINGAVPLVDRLVQLSRLRVLRPVTQQVVSLIHTLRH